MKRDLDLIRTIMMYLEHNLEYGQNIDNNELCRILQDEENSIKKVCYHLGLIREANWLTTNKSANNTTFMIMGITNDGHDFLDVIREQSTWEIIKSKAIKAGGYTLPMLVEFGLEYVKKMFLES